METVTITLDNFIELYTKAGIANKTSFSLLEQEWKKFYFTATSEKEVKKFFKKAEKEYKEKIDNYEKELNKPWYKLF